jgi:hypothetical protein
MKMFTFEIRGYCFYFECETWEQFEDALLNSGMLMLSPLNAGEIVFSRSLVDMEAEDGNS